MFSFSSSAPNSDTKTRILDCSRDDIPNMAHLRSSSSDSDDTDDDRYEFNEGTLETHCKVDRRYGIPRDVGLAWFDAARYGDIKGLSTIIKHAEQLDRDNNATNRQLSGTGAKGAGGGGSSALMRLLHYNGQATSYGFIGSIALHWAVANDDESMARLLLEKGSSVNCQNFGGSTPLHSACANGHPNMVTLLLAHGASPTIVDCCQDTPAEVVPPTSRREVAPLLLGAAAAERLASQNDTSKWSLADMKLLAQSALGDKEARKMIERSELVSACVSVLQQFARGKEKTAAADVFAKKLHEKVMRSQARRAARGELDEGDVAGAEEAKRQGNDAFGAGDVDKATKLYSTAIRLHPTEATYYSNRCACYLRKSAFQPAVKDAAMSVQLKPDWVKAHHRLGSALLGLGRYSDAGESFHRALQLMRKEGVTSGEGVDVIIQAMHECDEKLTAQEEAMGMRNNNFHDDEYEDPSDEEEEYRPPPPPVARGERKPWFDCVKCDNRTRDEAVTSCCRKKLCGTCLGRSRKVHPPKCPFCASASV